MRAFWSVLTVIGALGATEASAVNWNEGRYAPIGIADQLDAAQCGSGVSESLSPRR